MGQVETGSSKLTKSSQLSTVENAPPQLKTFADLLHSQQPSKLNPREFQLKAKDTLFSIKTAADVQDITTYQGFVEVFSGKERLFAGVVSRLRRQGFGVEYEGGRVFYRGEFENDAYHGWGQTVRYQGQFRGGKKEGWGRWEDGKNAYEGSFRDDRFHGIGYFNLKAKEIAAFMAQESTLGPTESAEWKYAGEWRFGRMEGSGKLISHEQIYQGGFLEGAYSGEGVLTSGGKAKMGKFQQGEHVIG